MRQRERWACVGVRRDSRLLIEHPTRTSPRPLGGMGGIPASFSHEA